MWKNHLKKKPSNSQFLYLFSIYRRMWSALISNRSKNLVVRLIAFSFFVVVLGMADLPSTISFNRSFLKWEENISRWQFFASLPFLICFLLKNFLFMSEVILKWFFDWHSQTSFKFDIPYKIRKNNLYLTSRQPWWAVKEILKQYDLQNFNGQFSTVFWKAVKWRT